MRKYELRHCKECRRLFSAAPTQAVCSDCLRIDYDMATSVDRAVDNYGCRTIDEIVEFTGLPKDDVLKIVRRTPVLRETVATDIPCRRCSTRTAAPDSQFCSQCRLELNRAFAHATASLMNTITGLADKRSHQPIGYKRMSVVRELRAKRAMTGMNRFDPTPRRSK